MASKDLKRKKAYVKGLITRARKKIDALKKENLLNESFAYSEALRTMYKSSSKAIYDDIPFSIEGLRTEKQLDKEKGRLLSFLGSEYSNVENVRYDRDLRQNIEDLGGKKQIESDVKEAKKEYGGKIFGQNIDQSANEVTKSVAAEVYRRLEEEYKNIIGKAAFDSDTLISILYDQVTETFGDTIPGAILFEGRKSVVDSVLAYGKTVLDAYKFGYIDKRFATSKPNYGGLKKRPMRGRK